MSSIAVICVSSSEKVVSQTTINVPATATIADVKAAMGCGTKKKAVQLLVCGAVPSESALIADLAAAYGRGNSGELHVSYSVEGSFGASTGCAVCTPLGGGSQWASM